MVESLVEAANAGMVGNQYCKSPGHPLLVEQLKQLYTPLFNREMKDSNFVVTDGATDGLFTTCQALINPGDECIVTMEILGADPPVVCKQVYKRV